MRHSHKIIYQTYAKLIQKVTTKSEHKINYFKPTVVRADIIFWKYKCAYISAVNKCTKHLKTGQVSATWQRTNAYGTKAEHISPSQWNNLDWNYRK